MLTKKQLQAQRAQRTDNLTDPEKADMVKRVCEAHGVPQGIGAFEFITVYRGKKLKPAYGEILYATRKFAAWACKENDISVRILRLDVGSSLVICQVELSMPGDPPRTWQAVGATPLVDKNGEALRPSKFASAVMHAKTKAQRRGILDMLGFGLLDETEARDMADEVPPEFQDPPPEAGPSLADEILDEAQTAINQAVKAGRCNDISDARSLIEDVFEAYADEISAESDAQAIRKALTAGKRKMLARAKKFFA